MLVVPWLRVNRRRRPERRRSELDMEPFANPVRLAVGDPSPGYVGERAPVPQRVGPRRSQFPSTLSSRSGLLRGHTDGCLS